MDFNKSEVGQRVAEQLAYSGLHTKYRLTSHRAKVQDAVIQPSVKIHLSQLLKIAHIAFVAIFASYTPNRQTPIFQNILSNPALERLNQSDI